jgi:16S rRNA (cytidine1402-2'-O)-methyltransferase
MDQGILYIIASPIGNLGDITYRAVKTMKEDIDILYCEDTRQSRKLTNFYEIDIDLKSLHSHSSDSKLDYICEIILQGKNIGYLTDAGTPGISDPGNKLVQYAKRKEIKIIPLPGASALASVISVSGFTGKNIIFSGFLSKKPGKRINELTRLKEFKGTIVIYESPYRIKKLLNDLKQVFPEKEIVIGREMTKMFEEFIYVKTEEIPEIIKEKGEFTIAINNN